MTGSSRIARDSTGTPASGAARAASDAAAPADHAEVAPAAQEEREAPPSVPAGEPEAPTGPTAPPQPAESEPDSDNGNETEEHEAKLERDLEELTAKAQKADEYLGLAQRTKADFENYRKRAARESAAAQERGVAKLARELLPALDNLDRAVAASTAAGDGDLVSGIKLVHADVIAAFARAGIKPFSPEGEPFDPQEHEAVAQQPVEGADPGTVVEVYQRGYRLGETVLRPAKVVVAG